MRWTALFLGVVMAWVGVGSGELQAKKRSLGTVRKVVIDPGHGGENTGALSYNGVYEKKVVLDIALEAKKLLEEATDVQVILTRTEDVDVPPAERIDLANREGADLFISLHCNSSFKAEANGVETLLLSEKALEEESQKLSRQVVPRRGAYAAAGDESAAAVVKEMLQYSAQRSARKFAAVVQKAIVRKTGFADRGIEEMAILVLRGAEMPAVVVELGFLSNPKEAEKLTSDRWKTAIGKGLLKAVVRYDAAISPRPPQKAVPNPKTTPASNTPAPEHPEQPAAAPPVAEGEKP